MVLSFASTSSLGSFCSSLFSSQTPEQKRDKASQDLIMRITDFLEAENHQLDVEGLFTQRSTINLIRACKEYGVDLDGYAVILLIYEAALAANFADIGLTNKYKELARALLRDCDYTEVAKSLVGLNIPTDTIAELIDQGADRCKVLAQLVVAFKNGQRNLEQVIDLLAQYHLAAEEKYIFSVLLEESGIDLNEITREAVRNSQTMLVMQLLSYGAHPQTIFSANHRELPVEVVVEEIRSLTLRRVNEIRSPASQEQIKRNALVARLRITLDALANNLASVKHAALAKAMLMILPSKAGATFKSWFRSSQSASLNRALLPHYSIPSTISTRHSI